MVAVMSSDDHRSAQRVLYVIASSTVKLLGRSTITIICSPVRSLRGIAGDTGGFKLNTTTRTLSFPGKSQAA